MGQKISPAVYFYIRIASTFGLTMGMNIYIMSVVIGGWIDNKLDTEPIFRLILLFIAIGMSFAYLFKQISIAKEVEEENKTMAKRKDDDQQ